jgi:hypothetical protein
MRLEQERPSDQIEDRRSMRGGFGFPGGGRRAREAHATTKILEQGDIEKAECCCSDR